MTDSSWADRKGPDPKELEQREKARLEFIERISGLTHALALDDGFQENLRHPDVQRAVKHWTGIDRMPKEEADRFMEGSSSYRINYVFSRIQQVQSACQSAGLGAAPLKEVFEGKTLSVEELLRYGQPTKRPPPPLPSSSAAAAKASSSSSSSASITAAGDDADVADDGSKEGGGSRSSASSSSSKGREKKFGQGGGGGVSAAEGAKGKHDKIADGGGAGAVAGGGGADEPVALPKHWFWKMLGSGIYWKELVLTGVLQFAVMMAVVAGLKWYHGGYNYHERMEQAAMEAQGTAGGGGSGIPDDDDDDPFFGMSGEPDL